MKFPRLTQNHAKKLNWIIGIYVNGNEIKNKSMTAKCKLKSVNSQLWKKNY